jgi:hypothetical protein
MITVPFVLNNRQQAGCDLAKYVIICMYVILLYNKMINDACTNNFCQEIP